VRLFADAWFSRGHSHRVCEDYALARAREADARAVLCDGCSGSPDTDVGARLLARAALAEHLHQLPTQAQALGLPVESLDATLAVIDADQAQIRVSLHGDGVLAVRRVDGAIALWVVDYPANAPAYPAHQIEPARLEQWRAAFGDARVVHHTAFDGATDAVDRPGAEALQWTFDWVADDLDLVAVFSDGALAFDAPEPAETSRSRRPVPAAEVVRALMQVPHPQTPRFAERRTRRFLSRTCAHRGWRPIDDLAVAMIARVP
jgi:hypothetical protein